MILNLRRCVGRDLCVSRVSGGDPNFLGNYLLPHQLTRSLAVRSLTGLFTAGQINGTSGYEEAAAQGLIAGINVALFLEQREPFVLKRSEAYIVVLIDDLISKDLDEPYRLLT